MRLSVVIPTCNRNDLLERCLEQLTPELQGISGNDFEIIVTDDSRSFESSKLQGKFPSVTFLQGPRRGPASNRNHGARHARGEWIVFTDDDCVPEPQWLSSFWKACDGSIAVYEGKTTCKEGVRSPLEHSPVNLNGGFLWSCNMMIHSGLFKQLGGFDEAFPFPHMEDCDMRERIKATGSMIRFVPSAIVDHPPRKVPWGAKRARMHESTIYYEKIKQGIPGNRCIPLLWSIFRYRLVAIKHHFAPGSAISALISLVLELAATAFMCPGWCQKYNRATQR
ncbi:MAG: glycosyltransferase family A protein [Verrucomicrobiota bacterium]|nr:glycosyltransferase family A protein [Verrucomicrobiota bacterium]